MDFLGAIGSLADTAGSIGGAVNSFRKPSAQLTPYAPAGPSKNPFAGIPPLYLYLGGGAVLLLLAVVALRR